MKKIFIITFVILVNILQAGLTGKLAGRITDENGKAVQFANLQIRDLNAGTQSNENGEYIIGNIPAGIYEVFCSHISYLSHQVNSVHVISDETTIVNITLKKQVQKIDGIEISEARNNIVDRLKTSSGNVVTSKKMEEIKIQDINEIIALQAGAFVVDGKLHIRGGKVNEVKYLIDGLPVNDIVDGESVLNIDVDAIKEMKVMTGGFPAEYGNAQSGIINIITKDGGKDYSGKIELISDHIISKKNQNNDQVKFNLSGPVLPFWREKFTFFINYSNSQHDSEFINEFGANAYQDFLNLDQYWQDYQFYNPLKNRNQIAGFDIGDRVYNTTTGNIKLSYKFSPTQKISFAVRGEDNFWQPYDHQWRYALEHYRICKRDQRQFMVSYQNVITPNLSVDFAAGIYSKKYHENPKGINQESFFGMDNNAFDLYAINEPGNTEGMLYFNEYGITNPENLLYWQYYIPQINSYEFIEEFRAPGSISPNFVKEETTDYNLKLDFDYQLNEIHSLKSGFDIVQHDIKNYKYSVPWIIDYYRYNLYLNEMCTPADSTLNSFTNNYYYNYDLDDIYDATLAASGETYGFKAKPWQFSWFLQDKMEWEGLVVNAGIRIDAWDLGSKYEFLNHFNKYEEKKLEADEHLHFIISPRLGISHTISTQDVLHFSFNRQSQLPQFRYIYPTASWFEQNTGNDDHHILLISNPNLEPQTTIAGEVGLQHQFNEDFIADATIFYKKNYNYVSIEKTIFEDHFVLEYYKYISENYGTSKGVDLNIQKQLANFIVGSLSYSLSWSEGTDARIYDYLRQDQKILGEFPMDWDARHNLSLNFGLEVGKDEYLGLPFSDNRIPLSDFSVNVLYNFASGTPYTDKSDEHYEINEKRKPYTDVMQTTFAKNFTLKNNSKIQVYFTIKNLFDKKNVDFAYIKTGSPFEDGVDLTDPNTGFIYQETKHIHDLYTKDPDNVSFGREIVMGMIYSW